MQQKNVKFNIKDLTDVFSKKTIKLINIFKTVCFGIMGLALLSERGGKLYGVGCLIVAVVSYLSRKKRMIYMYTDSEYVQLPAEEDNHYMDEILAYIAGYNKSCIKLERNKD